MSHRSRAFVYVPIAIALISCAARAPRLRARSLSAQSGAASNPAFDVASIKANKSGLRFVTMNSQPGGRFMATNVTPRQLITMAYRLQRFQLSGGPAWLDSEHFDIVAKAPAELADALAATLQGSPQAQAPSPLQWMMQALLADRFKLVVHNETRELPVYALVPARSDKQLGPRIHPSATDCVALAAAARGVLPPVPAPGQRPPCGEMMGGGRLSAGAFTLTQLARELSGLVQRLVLDRTDIAGAFDLDLTWTPDQIPAPPPGATDPPRINGFDVDPNGPSIFTAIQEQLGLKLESTKGPVDALVIDSIEQPTED